MRWLWRSGVVTLGLLAGPGAGQAQIWPLQVGPSADLVNNTFGDFDRFRQALPPRPAPTSPLLRTGAGTIAPAMLPPPPSPAPRVRRAAAPRPANRAVATAASPAAEPAGRRPDIEAVERRLTERERILRDLQRELQEERRLVDEWRGSQRASR